MGVQPEPAAFWNAPGVAGSDSRSSECSPDIASSASARSVTLRAIGPCTVKVRSTLAPGVRATRPMLGRMPVTPQKLAGLRSDPALSEPCAIQAMPVASATAALAKAGYGWGDVTLLIAHQANLRIAEAIQKSLKLRDDQVYNNIQRYGNTTSATIPIALDECVRSGRLKRGDLLVLTAFGSGFLWGSAVIRW